jgi:3-oxoacyl-[acyl-carrier-protein] synthase III|tara:strand:- start:4358 stop:5332 length:975 start_codon:yes stop_codon:yes gene_type:complete
MNAAIIGVGHHVPDNVVTNKDLEKVMETSDEWIKERSGIKERRFGDAIEESSSRMGYKAALMALQNAKIDKHDIDLIIFSTLNPDYFFPGCGVLLQRDLELKEIPALDIRQQCSGFVYGLSVAKAYINSGMYKNILFVCSEQQSAMLDLTTRGRNISVLFGDGAGAVVISATIEDKGILSTHLYSEGAFAEELTLKYLQGKGTVEEKDDNLPFMNGPLVFKHAVLRFSQAINEGLIVNNLKPENLDLFIPHQANLRISEFIQKKLNLTDNQVYNNIEKYGNTTSASIPIALSEANKKGKVKPGDMVCFAAFGSGFTWGSAFVKW